MGDKGNSMIIQITIILRSAILVKILLQRVAKGVVKREIRGI